MRRSTLVFVGLVFAPVLCAAGPAQLRSIDPLTLSLPSSATADVQLPKSDSRPADLKIAPSLLAKAADKSDKAADATLGVIVLLHEPATPSGTKGDKAAETLRVERLAVVEQAFVRDAPAGFTARRGLSHFPIVVGEVRRSDLMALAALTEVQAIEGIRQYSASRTEGAALIKASQLRTELGGTGKGIGVAIVDSGVDNRHPELASRVVAQADITHTTGDGTIDGAGHGTAVAGIVAGTDGGMAPEASLWTIKVLDQNGDGTSDDVLDGLNTVYANRNDHGGVRVVNMSLGDASSSASDCDGESPAFAQVLAKLTAAGIAVFAASGNYGFASGVSHPACLSQVISVGAVYDANIGPAIFSSCRDATTAADQITCYSNSGPPLDILAPSHCARTTRAGGGYLSCFGGTSAASPYAAGVAAQILSLRPSTTPEALREALRNTGRPITEPWTGLVRNRIDAVAAYERLTGAATTGFCAPGATTLCLAGGRFKVEAIYETPTGAAGQAQMVQLTDDSGYLWFFNNTNLEAVVKVLNACALGGKYWVFAGGLTNVRTTMTVTDTQTGTVKTYTNPQSTAFLPIQDTAAFATCP